MVRARRIGAMAADQPVWRDAPVDLVATSADRLMGDPQRRQSGEETKRGRKGVARALKWRCNQKSCGAFVPRSIIGRIPDGQNGNPGAYVFSRSQSSNRNSGYNGTNSDSRNGNP